MEIENRDLTTLDGWKTQIDAYLRYAAKRSAKEENELVDAMLVCNLNPQSGQRLDVPAGFICLTKFVGQSMDQVESSKDDFLFLLQTVCIAGDAIGSFFVSEAWVSSPGKDSPPDRRECVLVVSDHLQFGSTAYMATITHDGDKRVVGKWWADQQMKIGGRFANILLRRPDVLDDESMNQVRESARFVIGAMPGFEICEFATRDKC